MREPEFCFRSARSSSSITLRAQFTCVLHVMSEALSTSPNHKAAQPLLSLNHTASTSTPSHHFCLPPNTAPTADHQHPNVRRQIPLHSTFLRRLHPQIESTALLPGKGLLAKSQRRPSTLVHPATFQNGNGMPLIGSFTTQSRTVLLDNLERSTSQGLGPRNMTSTILLSTDCLLT